MPEEARPHEEDFLIAKLPYRMIVVFMLVIRKQAMVIGSIRVNHSQRSRTTLFVRQGISDRLAITRKTRVELTSFFSVCYAGSLPRTRLHPQQKTSLSANDRKHHLRAVGRVSHSSLSFVAVTATAAGDQECDQQ